MNYDGKDNLSLKILWRSAVGIGEVMIVGLVLYSWPGYYRISVMKETMKSPGKCEWSGRTGLPPTSFTMVSVLPTASLFLILVITQ